MSRYYCMPRKPRPKEVEPPSRVLPEYLRWLTTQTGPELLVHYERLLADLKCAVNTNPRSEERAVLREYIDAFRAELRRRGSRER